MRPLLYGTPALSNAYIRLMLISASSLVSCYTGTYMYSMSFINTYAALNSRKLIQSESGFDSR